MRIYDKTGEVLLDIPVDDDSYRYRAIAQAKKVELRYSLVDHVELPTGTYIEYQGERYTLWYPSDFKKEGTRVFDYTVTFGGNEEILKKYKYKLLSDKPYKLKFVMTATPRMFVELLVDNLNLYDSGWTVGTVIEAPEKLLSGRSRFESAFTPTMVPPATQPNRMPDITSAAIFLPVFLEPCPRPLRSSGI